MPAGWRCARSARPSRISIRRRRLQGRVDEFQDLGSAIAPAGADRRSDRARLHLAAGRIPSSQISDGYVGLRSARVEMPIEIAGSPRAMHATRKFLSFVLAFLCLGPLLATASMGQAEAAMIFVTNEKDDTVSVVDSQSLKLVNTIQVGHRPRGIIITPDKKDIIVCLGDDAQLAVIDAQSMKVKRLLDSGPDPEL